MAIKITPLPNSQIEIETEESYEEILKFENKAIENINQNLEIAGFRKGHIPRDILISQIGDLKIMEEIAELAIGPIYQKILKENKIKAIGQPEITITKIARNNPLGFKIKTAVLPEIKLADYKKMAQEILNQKSEKTENKDVTDQELEKAILQIRQMRMSPHQHQEGEECKHEEVELPELNDQFVKQLGPFSSVEDFKNKLRQNLKQEKENKDREQKRIKILEKIIEKTEIDLPKILIEAELNKMIHQLKTDIEATGLSFEKYLKQINKTETDIRTEWQTLAEKKARLGLILEEIAALEKIKVDPNLVHQEVSRLKNIYKDLDPIRAKLYVENILTNEKVFELLEKTD